MKLSELERVYQQVNNSEFNFIYLSSISFFMSLMQDFKIVSNLVIMKGVSACTPTSLNFLLCTDLESFAEMYAVDTGTLEVEASLVKTVLESQSSESTVNTLATFRSYLYSCQQAYNTLYLLSKITLTIAVTSTESERFFSVLKRIKA